MNVQEALSKFVRVSGRTWYPALVNGKEISKPTEWLPTAEWLAEDSKNADRDRGNPEVISKCKICGAEIQHFMVDSTHLYGHLYEDHGVTIPGIPGMDRDAQNRAKGLTHKFVEGRLGFCKVCGVEGFYHKE